MKYLPFEDFEIHTDMPLDEVYYTLCDVVDIERTWWFFTDKPFWGEVDRRYFRIWRATWWRSPVVSGKVIADGLGCHILVKMRLWWSDLLFGSLFYGFFWLAFFISPAEWIVQKIQTGVWQVDSPGGYLVAIVIFAFFYRVSVGIFKTDVRYIKEYLLWISQTNEENIIYRDQILGISESQIIRFVFVIPLLIALGWMLFKLLQFTVTM